MKKKYIVCPLIKKAFNVGFIKQNAIFDIKHQRGVSYYNAYVIVMNNLKKPIQFTEATEKQLELDRLYGDDVSFECDEKIPQNYINEISRVKGNNSYINSHKASELRRDVDWKKVKEFREQYKYQKF